MAIYGIIATHNTFAFYRARVALAAELRASGVPDTSVDNGWEYNLNVSSNTPTTSTIPASSSPLTPMCRQNSPPTSPA